MKINTAKLMKFIEFQEGKKLFPYHDTQGNITIGTGRNLTGRGISIDENDYLLQNDIDYFLNFLARNFEWFEQLEENRKFAIISLCFNVGSKKFLDFKKLIEHMDKKEYKEAAQEVLNSEYEKKLPSRSKVIAEMIETNNYIIR